MIPITKSARAYVLSGDHAWYLLAIFDNISNVGVLVEFVHNRITEAAYIDGM